MALHDESWQGKARHGQRPPGIRHGGFRFFGGDIHTRFGTEQRANLEELYVDER